MGTNKNNENKFTTGIYTLEKLADNRFIIPPYQRPYVWGDEQINKLLLDFYDAFSRKDEKYYVGTVLLYEKKSGDKTIFDLVDGQQRFTTLWLIAVAFKMLQITSDIEKFLKVGDELRIDFAIRKQIKSYMLSLLEKQVDEKNQYSDNEIESDEYLTHIAKAVTTILGLINNFEFQNGRDLTGFGSFIYQKVLFVANTVPENTDLNRLFAIINNSGVQLEQSDILKSLLLKNIKTEKSLYSRIWEACENMNSYFEKNVEQLFPQEFDWVNIQYDNLKELPQTTTEENPKEESNNAITIADILQKESKCNLKIDLRKDTTIKNLNLSEIKKISGKFYGTWIGETEIDISHSILYRVNKNIMKIQLQFFSDDKYAKGIELELKQDKGNINVKLLWAKESKKGNKYIDLLGKNWNDENLYYNVPIANYENGDGYGISELIINPEIQNGIDKSNSSINITEGESIVFCRSIINFPQLLLHAYRIFLKQCKEKDFQLPFHSDRLLQIFKDLTEKDEQTIKKFIKCLWQVRWVFDKEVVKWIQKTDEKEEELLLTSVSKDDNSFSRANKEKSEISMLQAMLYFTGNYNTQIWLTPYLKQLIDGEDSLSCLEDIDSVCL